MVKRQKEKQYLSATEQRQNQGVRAGRSSLTVSSSRHLPFSHCALTQQPIRTPVCNEEGILFERDALTGFVFKFKKDPATGKPMSTKDIIVLNVEKDEETGAWQCPILQKNFGDHVKVVAIRQYDNENTANVYSYQAFHELNVKGKNYTDLTSGKPFDRKKDVLVLCDPENETFNNRRDISQFYHIQHERELQLQKNEEGTEGENIRHSRTAARVLEKLKKKKRNVHDENLLKRAANDENKNQVSKRSKIGNTVSGVILAEDVTGIQFNTSQGSASLTSTDVTLAQDSLARAATEEEILQAEFRVMKTKLKGRKGYVRMNLIVESAIPDQSSNENSFSLAIELHCDIVPRTCANFLGLCVAGEYDGCLFHRLIPKFMIQGGKSKDEKKDESLWKDPFADEFDDRLTHSGPGQLSMANSGTNTNARQFFITFASCRHLDRKHTVFGKVVQGLEHLKVLERVATNNEDVPKQNIKIVSVNVLENPAEMAHNLEQKRLQAIIDLRQKEAESKTKKGPAVSRKRDTLLEDDGVGKYLKDRITKK